MEFAEKAIAVCTAVAVEKAEGEMVAGPPEPGEADVAQIWQILSPEYSHFYVPALFFLSLLQILYSYFSLSSK